MTIDCRHCYWYETCGSRDDGGAACWAFYPDRLEDMPDFEMMADLVHRNEEPASVIGFGVEEE